LWSNPGDVVWSPFAGIGSEGVVAVRKRRRFVGTELKLEYWQQAARHLKAAQRNAVDLFDGPVDLLTGAA
jgi:DNA modification methylase